MQFGKVTIIGSLLAMDGHGEHQHGIGAALTETAGEAVKETGHTALREASYGGPVARDTGTSEGAKKANEGRQHASSSSSAAPAHWKTGTPLQQAAHKLMQSQKPMGGVPVASVTDPARAMSLARSNANMSQRLNSPTPGQKRDQDKRIASNNAHVAATSGEHSIYKRATPKEIAAANKRNVPGGPPPPTSKGSGNKPFKTAYGTAGGGSMAAVGKYNRAQEPAFQGKPAFGSKDAATTAIFDAMPHCVNLDAPMVTAASSGPMPTYKGKVL